jgi:cytoskeletal protein CcmA (bactofilin family)
MEVTAMEVRKPTEGFRADMAHIGKSVVIKGELSGSEDLYLDGEVEGRIELNSNSLTIGPNGRIRANIHAREVVLHGRLDGNIEAQERVELKQNSVLNGDVVAQRILIEDGAFLKGSVDIQKESAKSEGKRDSAKAAVATVAPVAAVSAGVIPPDSHGSLVDAKK